MTKTKDLLLRLIGVIQQEPFKSKCCAYKIRLDLKIDDGVDVSQESSECLSCNGYPRECFSYTDLDHVLRRYKVFTDLEGRR